MATATTRKTGLQLNTEEVIVINLIKKILQCGGELSLKELMEHARRFPRQNPRDGTINVKSVVQRYDDVFRLCNGMVSIKCQLNFCKAHWSKAGCNDEKKRMCDKFHICKFFLTDECRNNERCSYGHGIKPIEQHLLRYLTPEELLQIIRIEYQKNKVVATEIGNQALQICTYYNSTEGCTRGEKCKYLHICKNYINSHCTFGAKCRYSHNIFTEQNKKILDNAGINVRRSPKLVLNDIKPIFSSQYPCNLEEAEDESSSENEFNEVKICTYYNTKGCTRGDTCRYLHICKNYINSNCKFGSKCQHSHNIFTEQNKKILDNAGYNVRRSPKAVLDEIKTIIRSQDSLEDSEDEDSSENEQNKVNEVKICTYYNTKGCSRGDKCLFLHVCDNYINSQCKFGTKCRYSHHFDSDQNQKILGQAVSVPKVVLEKMQTVSTSLEKNPDNFANDVNLTNICTYHLIQKCKFGAEKCRNIHSKYYFLWQYSDDEGQKWTDITNEDQKKIEVLYQNPENDGCSVNISKRSLEINFDDVCLGRGNVRRLGTYSWGDTPENKPFVTKWLWYFRDHGNKWTEYGQECKGYKSTITSRDIEEQFLDKHVTNMDFKAGIFQYKIHFQEMEQENLRVGTRRALRRRPQAMEQQTNDGKSGVQRHINTEIEYPDTWSMEGATSLENPYYSVEVKRGTPEFQDIEKLFKKSMDSLKIVTLSRIQNYDLWEDYWRMKQKMLRYMNNANINEMRLFHGTNEAYIDAICQQGFDCRLSGSAVGTLYGKGTYFARDSKYSSSYCNNKMFVAKVLAGSYTVGKQSFARPPPKDPSKPTGLYDSCVNNISDPTIHVIFDNRQSYPEYIIEFR